MSAKTPTPKEEADSIRERVRNPPKDMKEKKAYDKETSRRISEYFRQHPERYG